MDSEDDKPTTWNPAEGGDSSPHTGPAGQSPDPPSRPGQADGVPRQSFWAAMPRRSVMRVLILFAALFGIIYLRKQTASIAGCMENAFRAPAPAATETAARARIELQVDASGEPSR